MPTAISFATVKQLKPRKLEEITLESNVLNSHLFPCKFINKLEFNKAHWYVKQER